jgi:uncharacterized membrane protein
MFNTTPEIFLYPTEFVLAGESVFSTDFLFTLLGYLAGLAVVLGAFFAVYITGKKLGAKASRIFLTVQAALFLSQAVSAILQFLVARRLIPLTDMLFDFVIFAVNHSEAFTCASVAVSAAVILMAWRVSRRTLPEYPNPAERRKAVIAGIRVRRMCSLGVICAVIAVLSVTSFKVINEREVVLSPAEDMEIQGGEILISLEQVNDGHLHRFAYTASDGAQMRFIVIKKNDIAFGVGLDACDICGPTGYYERKGEVICKLCDVVMNKQTIGFKGGCNPVPLPYALEGGIMVIKTEDLDAESNRFA